MSSSFADFKLNNIIEFHNSEGVVSVLRILAIYPKENSLIVIDIYTKNSKPFALKISSRQQLEQAQIVNFEPHKKLWILGDEHLTPGARKLRDKAWDAIHPIIYTQDGRLNPDLFSRLPRARIISRRAKELAGTKSEVKVQAIKKYVRLFWIRGL